MCQNPGIVNAINRKHMQHAPIVSPSIDDSFCIVGAQSLLLHHRTASQRAQQALRCCFHRLAAVSPLGERFTSQFFTVETPSDVRGQPAEAPTRAMEVSLLRSATAARERLRAA